jgi:hypothetical protein
VIRLDQTKGILVVSFPRSGSSEFCRALVNLSKANLSHYPERKPWAEFFGEFFNYGDTTTFGNLNKAHAHFVDYNVPYLADTFEVDPDLQQKILPNQFNIANLLIEKSITFESQFDIENYYADQVKQRLNLFQSKWFTDRYFPIVKHFPLKNLYESSTSFDPFASMESLTLFEQIFYYRKDVIGSLYSSLIKWFYYDAPTLSSSIKLELNLLGAGHNYQNSMPPLAPQKGIYFTEKDINIGPIIESLLWYKKNKHRLKNIICYETFFDKSIGSQTILLGNVECQIDVAKLKFEEFPMNYSTDKRNYFENPELATVYLKNSLAQYKLLDVADELELILE